MSPIGSPNLDSSSKLPAERLTNYEMTESMEADMMSVAQESDGIEEEVGLPQESSPVSKEFTPN